MHINQPYNAVLDPYRGDPFNSGINSEGEDAKPKVVTTMGVARPDTLPPPQLVLSYLSVLQLLY